MSKYSLLVCILAALLTSGECFLPEDISNFLNEYICNTDTRLVRPLTIRDVKEAVKKHGRVQAVGTGHSWNKFYCASWPSETEGNFHSSANIVMTTIRPLEIKVNAKELSVWVSAGVTVRDLVLYLANYVTPVAPRGYTLLTFPSFVNQTIAGAIATGTHGSTIKHGSLSNQVLAVRAVLANGTLVEISEESHPFLIKAFRVNVGRLGVVTDVKLRIAPEVLATRTLTRAVPDAVLMEMMKSAQETYKETGSFPEWMEELHFWWMVTNGTSEMHTVEVPEHADNTAESDCEGAYCYRLNEESAVFLKGLLERINAPVNVSRSEKYSDVACGVTWEPPSPLPPVLPFSDPNITFAFEAQVAEIMRTYNNNLTAETHEARAQTISLEDTFTTPFDEYSFGVPADKMADCFEEFMLRAKRTAPDNGIHGIVWIRFVGKDDALLSVTHSQPHLVIGLDDLVYYNQQNRSSNVRMKELISFLVSSPLCSPVFLHWGKGGWPDPGCWNGAEFYEETWCDFGCAVLELDPYGKFVGGDPDVWNWNGANLEKCCTPDGYDTSLEGCGCDVIPVRAPDECPEAPFYTNR